MKKSIKHAVCMLAVIHAGVATADCHNEIGNKELRDDLLVVAERSFILANNWPGSSPKVKRWAVRRVTEWRDILDGSDHDRSMSCLISASSQVLTDLYENLKDDAERELLEPMLGPLGRCGDFFHGRASYDIHTEADRLLQPLYDLIGFETLGVVA